MKLFDSNPSNNGRYNFDLVESFDGGMSELSHQDVTKSFNKSKKKALKRLKAIKANLDCQIAELEKMEESDVYHRDTF